MRPHTLGCSLEICTYYTAQSPGVLVGALLRSATLSRSISPKCDPLVRKGAARKAAPTMLRINISI